MPQRKLSPAKLGVIFQLLWITLNGPELRCPLSPDLASAAHFSWEYNTGEHALIPGYVPLFNLNIICNHEPRPCSKFVFSPFVSLCLFIITCKLSGGMTLRRWLIRLCAAFPLNAFIHDKRSKKSQKCHKACIFACSDRLPV